MRIVKKLFEGKRGEIFLVEIDSGTAVYKKEKPPYKFAAKEYEILRYLNGLFSPKPIALLFDGFLMEYVEGDNFKKALKENRKMAIDLAMEACRYLDEMGVYHSQLGRYYHLMMEHKRNRIKILDFERAKLEVFGKNLPQFLGFYLKESSRDIKELLAAYKKEPALYYKIKEEILKRV